MRQAILSLSFLVGACTSGLDTTSQPAGPEPSGPVAGVVDPGFSPGPFDHEPHHHPDGGSDGGSGSDGGCATPTVLFETATLPSSGPYNMLPAIQVTGDEFTGARFTTTEAHAITALGAGITTDCQGCVPQTVVIAIVPLDPATNLPMTTDLSDAVGYASGDLPYYPDAQLPSPPPSTEFPASFTLPPGTWGIVVASDRLGVPYSSGDLPVNVTPVGTPSYIHYAEDGGVEQNPGVWYDGLAGYNVRLFVEGI